MSLQPETDGGEIQNGSLDCSLPHSSLDPTMVSASSFAVSRARDNRGMQNLELDGARVVLAESLKRAMKDPEAVLEPGALVAALVVEDQDPPTYERYRRNLKDRHVRVAPLDAALRRLRSRREAEMSSGIGATPPSQVAPWPQVVDGASLLEDISSFFLRHVVTSEASADAIALWVLHAHALDAAEHTPRLRLISPEKRCAKSRTITILHCLVPRPLLAANATPAALFHHIALGKPTLLIDEGDTFLTSNRQFRGIINAGHERSNAYVLRADGKFSVWASLAIASIGPLWDTLEDRSIHVHLKRRLPQEEIQPFRKTARALASVLCQKAARWRIDNFDVLRNSDPDIPDELDDRGADNWRALLAIADTAGVDWGRRARAGAIELSCSKSDDSDSFSVRFLAEIERMFIVGGTTKLRSGQICRELASAWSSYGGHGALNEFSLAAFLRPFGIAPKVLRFAGRDPEGKPIHRGYDLADFRDALERYVRAGNGAR